MGHLVVRNTSELCLPSPDGASVAREPHAALVARDGVVTWVGPESLLPASEADGAEELDAEGRALVPALVDAHTHLVYAGDRVLDFTRRVRGMTYAEIAAEGGGILTTVRATRAASFDELLSVTRARLVERRALGILTTEIKSGYGLSVEHELRLLEVVAALAREGFDVEGTLLAAHAVPRDIERATYVSQITGVMIPDVARRGLARFVDVFVERGAYTADEAREIFAAARAHGLLPRLHADQITSGGGAELAAEVGAVSADHLERISDEGLRALADRRVIATLLPGAATYLGDEAPRLGRRLHDAGVEIAVATDQNPGSSPTKNLALMATLAATRFGLSAEEALRAITLGAAHALRRADVGSLTPGMKARFLQLEHEDSRVLVASFGEPCVRRVVEA